MGAQLHHAGHEAAAADGVALRRVRLMVYGVAGLAALLVVAGIALWMRYGVATFFDVLAAGIATCF